MLAVSTRKGSWVRPKIAGIESSAKSRSVVPKARMTMNIGVMLRLPLEVMNSLVPYHWLVAGKRDSTHFRKRFSSYSSSSLSPSRARLTAVKTRNAPKT